VGKVVGRVGNCQFHAAARNFNPAAMAGRVTIVEAERIVDGGKIDPEDVHLPGHAAGGVSRHQASGRSGIGTGHLGCVPPASRAGSND